jgi:effector-binding domain-containing protein
MKNKYAAILLFIAVSASIISSCNNSNQKKTVTIIDTFANKEKKTKPAEKPQRAPIINISDTVSIKRIILCTKDSAATFERIGTKLGEMYMLKLGAVIKKNGVKVTGQPMAWYTANKAPYFFEAGIPVDKKPTKITNNLFIKEMGVDSVTIAHFYGPYNLLPQAYDALRDWMTDHKKKLSSTPYEIYVSDPVDKEGHLIDPYKVQTDVVFPWK